MQKIRVCHLTTAHEPFDDRIFHKQCKSLAKAGYEVALIAQHDKNEVVDGIRIIALKKAKNRIHRILGLSAMLLYKAILQRADIYHFHDPEVLPVGVLIKILTFKKVIYDVHEEYAQKILSKYWIHQGLRKPVSHLVNFIEKVSCKFFDYIITADSHIKLKFKSSKTEVLANYPPLDFVRDFINKKDSNVMKVIYTGGISEIRGIHMMLEAMKHLSNKDIEMHLLGDVHDSEFIKLLDSYENVRYHGSVPWNEVSKYLLEADVGLVLLQPVPAYIYCPGENIIKLFEYMIAGLCVLISDFPKLVKLVSEIGCGISVDPTDPKKIAGAIEFLYNNADLRKRMGLNGRKAVLEKYNWEIESKKLMKIYEKVYQSNQRD
jgi:glycosyltransferase involved in cell wall biosynthesis